MNMRATFHLLGITDVWFCTVCYGCMLVMVGNAVAKHLENNRRIASFASVQQAPSLSASASN
jgi:hypothetical protein